MPLPLLAIGFASSVVGGAGLTAYMSDWFKKDESKFPIRTVKDYLAEVYGKDVYSENAIKDLYSVYILGTVKNKLPAYDYRNNPTVLEPGQQAIIQFMQAQLPGYSLGKIRNFCFALQYLASNGVISVRFWHPLASAEAKKVAAEYKKEALEIDDSNISSWGASLNKVESIAKWGGIALLGLTGLGILKSFADFKN